MLAMMITIGINHNHNNYPVAISTEDYNHYSVAIIVYSGSRIVVG